MANPIEERNTVEAPEADVERPPGLPSKAQAGSQSPQREATSTTSRVEGILTIIADDMSARGFKLVTRCINRGDQAWLVSDGEKFWCISVSVAQAIRPV